MTEVKRPVKPATRLSREWWYGARGIDGRCSLGVATCPLCPKCPPRGRLLNSIDRDAEGYSLLGLRSMVGHVWQWCEDSYRGHPQYRGGEVNAKVYLLRTTRGRWSPLNTAATWSDSGWYETSET